MQGGKNWILPKDMNANRFFWESHWLEIWSNHFCTSMGPNGGTVALDSGWLEGVGFCTDGRAIPPTACLFHTVPVALAGAAQLRADGIFSCCKCSKCTLPSVRSYVMSCNDGMAWYSRSPMLSL
jgi:hypothetical protein